MKEAHLSYEPAFDKRTYGESNCGTADTATLPHKDSDSPEAPLSESNLADQLMVSCDVVFTGEMISCMRCSFYTLLLFLSAEDSFSYCGKHSVNRVLKINISCLRVNSREEINQMWGF